MSHRSPIQIVLSIFFLQALALLMSGCAATNTFPDELKVTSAELNSKLSQTANRVIAVRYPALVERDAREALEDNSWRRALDAVGGFGTFEKGKNAGGAAMLEMSSAFHAAQLFLAIQRLDPSLIVLLEPHAVRVGPSGKLESVALSDARPFSDVSPYLWTFHWAESGLGSPLFYLTIQTSPLRSPENCGLLYTTVLKEPLASEFTNSRCRDPSHGNGWISSYLLDGKHRRSSEVYGIYRDALPTASRYTVQGKAFGTKGFVDFVTASATAAEKSAEAGVVDLSKFMVEPVLSDLASLTVGSLAIPVPARDVDIAPYIADFDLALADALSSGRALTSGEGQNLNLLKRIRNQELRVRSKRDSAIVEEILTGKYGKSFIEARTMARGEGASYFWRVVGTSVLSVGTMAVGMASGLAVAAAPAFVAQYSSSVNADYAKDHANYLRTVAPTLSRAGDASLDLLDKELTVVLSDQRALRTELRLFYASRRAAP